eukprot:Platyproteum_vivax@DN7491_c0_g1_i1.p1
MNQKIGMLVVFLSMINLVTALRISSLSQNHLKSHGVTDPSKDGKSDKEIEKLQMKDVAEDLRKQLERIKCLTEDEIKIRESGNLQEYKLDTNEKQNKLKESLHSLDSMDIDDDERKDLQAQLKKTIQGNEDLLKELNEFHLETERLRQNLRKQEMDLKFLAEAEDMEAKMKDMKQAILRRQYSEAEIAAKAQKLEAMIESNDKLLVTYHNKMNNSQEHENIMQRRVGPAIDSLFKKVDNIRQNHVFEHIQPTRDEDIHENIALLVENTSNTLRQIHKDFEEKQAPKEMPSKATENVQNERHKNNITTKKKACVIS